VLRRAGQWQRGLYPSRALHVNPAAVRRRRSNLPREISRNISADGSAISDDAKLRKCSASWKNGSAAGFGRWFGNSGNGELRAIENSANAASLRRTPRNLPEALMDRGTSSKTRRCRPLCQTLTWPRSDCRSSLRRASLTRRTAVCGPACTVVWQGRVGDHSRLFGPFANALPFSSPALSARSRTC